VSQTVALSGEPRSTQTIYRAACQPRRLLLRRWRRCARPRPSRRAGRQVWVRGACPGAAPDATRPPREPLRPV